MNECASNPCQNSVQCEDGINQYTCQCVLGFDGVNCEINANPCAGVTCLNDAQVGPSLRIVERFATNESYTVEIMYCQHHHSIRFCSIPLSMVEFFPPFRLDRSVELVTRLYSFLQICSSGIQAPTHSLVTAWDRQPIGE